MNYAVDLNDGAMTGIFLDQLMFEKQYEINIQRGKPC